MKRLINSFGLLFLFAVLLSACGPEQAEGEGDGDVDVDNVEDVLDSEFITMLTGGSSGVYYPLGGSLAKIYQDLGANANSQSTAASAANITTLEQGKAEIAFSMGDAASDADEGIGSFEEQGKQENVRAIADRKSVV